MRPEQFAYDTAERPQRRYPDVECEECGRALLGNRAVGYYPDDRRLCAKCDDRLTRLEREAERRWG